MSYIYSVTTNTGYVRTKDSYGELIAPYMDWDEETSEKFHATKSGALARIESELASFKRDYPDGICKQVDERTFQFVFADGTIEEWCLNRVELGA